jgi:hypothetical protein
MLARVFDSCKPHSCLRALSGGVEQFVVTHAGHSLNICSTLGAKWVIQSAGCYMYTKDSK